MISDFVVVETNNFQDFIKYESPAEGRPSASWKGLTEINIVELWSILLNEEYSEERRKSLQMLFSEDGGKVWLVVFPDDLVLRLSALNETDLLTTGSKWSKIDEFKWGWTEADVQELLKDIVELARTATKDEKPLIMWGAL
jgi:hypothetical protein